jgi:hypothetical protein
MNTDSRAFNGKNAIRSGAFRQVEKDFAKLRKIHSDERD